MPTDTERLDWMGKNRADYEFGAECVLLSWTKKNPDGSYENVRVDHVYEHRDDAEALRHTIDLAMAQQAGEERGE